MNTKSISAINISIPCAICLGQSWLSAARLLYDIVRSFLNLTSRRICQGMSEANTPSPSWRHGCWDFRSSHPILVAWLWRCTFRVYVFFSCFFFAQRHHIQIAQAVNSMAFSWHPDLNEVCVTCWNRIVRAMFLPCLSCVMTAQKNEVPYRLELLIPWLGLFHILLAWLEEKVSLWLHGLNK